MENDETLFDEIVRTEIKPDGTVEASLVDDAAQEMKAAAQNMVRCWEDFKAASPEYPKGAWSREWWRSLELLALAEDRLKEGFLGRDRSPKSVAQYHKWRLSLCDKRPFRSNA